MQFHAHRPSRRNTLVAVLGAVVGMALLLGLSIGGGAVTLPPGWAAQNSHNEGNLNGISVVQATDGTYHGASVGGNNEVWSTDGQVWHPGHNDTPPDIPPGYSFVELALNRVIMVDKDFGYAVGESPDISYYSKAYTYTGGFGGAATILITQDGGKSWHTVDSGDEDDLEGVFFSNQFEGWVVGDNGTLRHNTNGGSGDWIQQNTAAASCSNSSAAPAKRNEREVALAKKKPGPAKPKAKTKPKAPDPRVTNTGSCGLVGISVHLNSNGQLEGWAVGDDGVIMHNLDAGNDSSTWSVVVQGGSNRAKDFEGFTCIDANNCVAVGDQGRIVRIVNGVVQPDIFADSTIIPGNRGGPEMELYGVAMAKAGDGSLHGFAVGGSAKNTGYAGSADPLQGVIVSTTNGFNTVTVNYTDFRPFKDVSMPNACTAWASGKTEGFNAGTGYTTSDPAFGSGKNGALIKFTDPNNTCPAASQAPANVGLPTTGGINKVSQALKAQGVNPINGLLGAAVAVLLAVLAWGGLRLRWTN